MQSSPRCSWTLIRARVRLAILPQPPYHGGELTVLEALHAFLQHQSEPLGSGTDERADEAHVGSHEAIIHGGPGEGKDGLHQRRVRLVEFRDDVGEGLEPGA